MKLAVLFWIYKDLDVCRNRARWLRRLNPDTPVYCLFGGQAADAEAFRVGLGGLIDDFYVFDQDWDAHRKWWHGDQMISRWYEDRGRLLEWDTVFIAQWDMLLLGGLDRLCGGLQPEQLILPSYQEVAAVEHYWWWVQPECPQRPDYDAFLALMRRQGYDASPHCCHFVSAALPRSFLERYAAIPEPDVGFLEYKMPTYAAAWGYAVSSDHVFDPAWKYDPDMGRLKWLLAPINAEGRTIPGWLVWLDYVRGKRAFHPYYKSWRR